jgi:hypothetical protein
MEIEGWYITPGGKGFSIYIACKYSLQYKRSAPKQHKSKYSRRGYIMCNIFKIREFIKYVKRVPCKQ